ncbi:RNA polymerase sigma factor [Polaribacter sp. WD7]|uniref:RNA polymerase sigma factor n=1 Tax=Polaribacter sp. WD7 TaxID=2269061 RepID=UPI000DF43CC4|nr:RNA polymerase sigma factor [Polaribacter sp. WD7]RCS26541.1 RNA polymerase sigma factor [Polaribacter sp. WD7]
MNKENFKLNVFSLSERIYPMVARMLGTIDAEDAIQEIMFKLWQRRKQVAKHPNIKGLVFLTARNYCIDVLRKKNPIVNDSSIHLTVLESPSIENSDLHWGELHTIIIQILKKLPKQQKEVFVMRDIDGYEFSEIASALRIKIDHTRVLVSRARKFIGTELEKKYNYERGKY